MTALLKSPVWRARAFWPKGVSARKWRQQYKEQGDLYLSKAQGYIEIISNQEQIDASRQSGSQTTFVRIRSPKQEAIEASKLAMDYYDQALSTFPQMDQIVRQEIAYSRAKARQYYTRLTNKTPMNLPRTPHSLGKVNSLKSVFQISKPRVLVDSFLGFVLDFG